MALKEKAAYLRGLADGLDYDRTTAEGKLIAAMIDLLDELTGAMDELDENVQYLGDYIEEIDKDLGDVEEFVFDDGEPDEGDDGFGDAGFDGDDYAEDDGEDGEEPEN